MYTEVEQISKWMVWHGSQVIYCCRGKLYTGKKGKARMNYMVMDQNQRQYEFRFSLRKIQMDRYIINYRYVYIYIS